MIILTDQAKNNYFEQHSPIVYVITTHNYMLAWGLSTEQSGTQNTLALFLSINYRNTISAMKSLFIFRSWINMLANICGEQNKIIGLIVDP